LGIFKTSGFPTETFGNDRHFVLSFGFGFGFGFSFDLSPSPSFAEFGCIGSANTIVSGLLVLCARTAHQDGRVGNAAKFRHPQGKRCWEAFFGYFLGL